MIPLFLAETTPASSDVGIWVIVAVLVMNGIAAIAGVAALFATRREVENIEKRVGTLEANIDEINRDNEKRAKDLHDRINPVVENTAEIKGQMKAFAQSFDNFTEMMTHEKRRPN